MLEAAIEAGADDAASDAEFHEVTVAIEGSSLCATRWSKNSANRRRRASNGART